MRRKKKKYMLSLLADREKPVNIFWCPQIEMRQTPG